MLSIVTPVLNGAKTLPRLLASSQIQTGDFNHLFVDGGSTDGSRELLSEFIDAPGSGLYEAMNIGIRASQYDWVTTLGCDDYLFPDAVARLCDELVKLTDDVALVRVHIQIENQRPWYRTHQQSFVYHRRLFEKYGYFDESGDVRADGAFAKLIKDEPYALIPLCLTWVAAGGKSGYA